MECKNVGSTDQLIRVGVAILLVAAGMFVVPQYSIILFIIAAILALTSLVQFCPLYKILGVNTCEYKKAKTIEEAKENAVEGQKTKSKKVMTTEEYKKEEEKPATKKKKATAKKSSKKKTSKKKTSKSKTTKAKGRKKKR